MAVTAIGIPVASKLEKIHGEDPSLVVIDEVAGTLKEELQQRLLKAGVVVEDVVVQQEVDAEGEQRLVVLVLGRLDVKIAFELHQQLDARQRQKVLDQTRHAPALVLHHAQETALRLRVLARWAQQGLDEAEQAGQGRA